MGVFLKLLAYIAKLMFRKVMQFYSSVSIVFVEKEMATHSSVLAWRIPGMAEPGRLPSMESHRVRHD